MELQNRWQKSENIMQDYPSRSYKLIHCGIRVVKTKDIIGLSLWSPEALVKDRKINWLRQKVHLENLQV